MSSPIPDNISREDIIEAIENGEVKERGKEEKGKRKARKYFMKYNNNCYSPKYVITKTYEVIYEEKLSPDDFGPTTAKDFLKDKNFQVFDFEFTEEDFGRRTGEEDDAKYLRERFHEFRSEFLCILDDELFEYYKMTPSYDNPPDLDYEKWPKQGGNPYVALWKDQGGHEPRENCWIGFGRCDLDNGETPRDGLQFQIYMSYPSRKYDFFIGIWLEKLKKNKNAANKIRNNKEKYLKSLQEISNCRLKLENGQKIDKNIKEITRSDLDKICTALESNETRVTIGEWMDKERVIELDKNIVTHTIDVVEKLTPVYASLIGEEIKQWPTEPKKSKERLSNIIKRDLKFDKFEPTKNLHFPNQEIIKSQIESALKAGKNIIFIGPPGTGKTKIAKNVAEQMKEKNKIIDGFTFTTATADWTTFDTIGGYHPEKEEATSLEFKPGIFLRCFKEDKHLINKWLIIDEINRADIDKAFGQLFSVLSEDNVELQFTKESEASERKVSIKYLSERDLDDNELDNSTYVVTPNWRLLATMNTYDKSSLYEMSYAFMRRFAFIDVSVPSIEIDKDLIDKYIDCWNGLDPDNIGEKLKEKIAEIWSSLNESGRAIGPAIVEDMLRFLVQDNSLDLVDALILFVLPQLEGLVENEQKHIIEELWGNEDVDKNKLKEITEERFEIDNWES